MTREEAKELLPIIQAYAEGEKIEMLDFKGRWVKMTNPDFTLSPENYRIKPEYRPFKTKEECWDEMHCHSDFGWLIRIDTGVFAFVNIKAIFSEEIVFDNDFDNVYTFKNAFKYYKFIDGTPFGIKLPTNI